MARSRQRQSPFLSHRRQRRSELRGPVERPIDERGLDIIRHTLAVLIDDGLISAGNNLEDIFDRTVQTVSVRMTPPVPPKALAPPKAAPPPKAPPPSRQPLPKSTRRKPGKWTGPPEFHMVAGDIAQSLAAKWGSARAALDHATVYGEKAGRKPNWLKILESMAADEERAASPDGSVPKNFSHIPRTPKVSVGESVTDDHIVCLVDGTPRRHLASYIHAKYGMTPEDYRRHFDLPKDYPMVAPTSTRKRTVKSPAETNVKTSVKTNRKPSFLKASNRRNSPSLGNEEAQLWIDEWGSAREALRKAMVGRDGPGRKPDWLKKLEDLADEEQRLEVKQRPADQYAFSHISRTPAVPVSKSLAGKHIICLVDGSKKTFLTRYLLAKFGMTPQDYRIHFGLPSDYPMTATGYRERKSELAIHHGLGRGPKVKRRR